MDQRDFIASWESIHTIIDEALEKRDRSVLIYVSPDGGLSISVHPWPDPEDLYRMYCQGEITFSDFRKKAGLPMMREEDFLRQFTRGVIRKVETEEEEKGGCHDGVCEINL